MYINEDGLDFRDPYERQIILQQRQEELAEKLKEKKERNKTYLKGQRGVRRYYDYKKLESLVYEDKDEYFSKTMLAEPSIFPQTKSDVPAKICSPANISIYEADSLSHLYTFTFVNVFKTKVFSVAFIGTEFTINSEPNAASKL